MRLAGKVAKGASASWPRFLLRQPLRSSESYWTACGSTGFADGVTVRIESVLSESPEALDQGVADLVRTNVDLIVAWSTPAISAAKRATSTIPIVMVGIADPIGAKFVDSLARPGG